MKPDEMRVPAMFKALCDENRVQILKYLADGEKCACKLLSDLSIAQPTLSHHMKTLTDSGLVAGRKEGKWMYYRISPEGLDAAIDFLNCLRRQACSCPEGCCEDSASECCGGEDPVFEDPDKQK